MSWFFLKSWLQYVSVLTGRKPGGSVHPERQQGAPWQSHLLREDLRLQQGWVFLTAEWNTHHTLGSIESGSSCSFPKEATLRLLGFFFWPDSHCLCNTAGNGFVTTANQNVQPLRRDCLIHLTRPCQGEFTLWRRFWFYTACICKWRFIWLALLF